MKWILAALVAGALTLGSVVVAVPASAANPSATVGSGVIISSVTPKRPVIKSGKTNTIKTKSPNKSVQKVTLPVLQNSTAKNRRAFSKLANELVSSELKHFNSYRKGMCGKSTAQFEISPLDMGIYKNRYATVSMSTFMYFCGATGSSGAKSFTLDLKTGKKVSINKFVSQDDVTTKIAIVNNFSASRIECLYDDLNPGAKKNDSGAIPRPIAWTVGNKGIKFHFQKYSIGYGYCGVPSVVLPWAEVATAAQLKGAVKNRTYVKGVKYDQYSRNYNGEVLMTSVQNRKVTIFQGEFVGPGGCLLGVRSGKSAVLGFVDIGSVKEKLSLTDSGSNPKLVASKLGKGWHLASATEIKRFKTASGLKQPTAKSLCGS